MLAVNVDVPTAIALYQQAIDIAAESGTRTVEETCRGMQLGLTAQTDDLEAALMGFADAVDAWQDSMGDVYAAAGTSALATWLAGRGYHDGAARLFGVNARGHPETWVNPPPEFVALPEVMGDAEFTSALEAGAALDVRAAAALAHLLLAQVRADHLDA